MTMNAEGELSESAARPLVLEASKVILAMGQDADDIMNGKEISETDPSVYITGDFRDGSGTVIQACAAGRKTARQILTDFGHAPASENLTLEPIPSSDWKRNINDLQIPLQPLSSKPLDERMNQRIEVELGYAPAEAQTEAARCYLCNYKFTIDADRCIYCMKCIDGMPVNGISLTKGEINFIDGKVEFTSERNYNGSDSIVIDYDACVRCGECVRACPVDCISIEKFALGK